VPRRPAGLTARRVETVKRPGAFADGGGLYLEIAKSGAKSWVFRYQIGGRRRDMGLGSVKTFGLAEARERALEARRAVARGIDPIETRRAQRGAAAVATAKSMTFAQCADAFIAAHQTGWRNEKHRYQWRQTVASYMNPVLGALDVQVVDVGLVMKAIEPIWTVKPETAGRVRGRIESILDWATTRGDRTGENPARWRGHLENLLPARSKVRRVEHYAALPYPEIGAFMSQLRRSDGPSARALDFAILTAARTGEVIGARWDEINVAERIWTVPADRMKAGREHRVPLSNAALAIVEKMAAIRTGEYVFPGGKAGRPMSNMALLMLLRRMGRGDLTAHGFRSTFRDWAAERTNFPAEVAEMALAHTVSDKVEAAYRRGDLFEKRREIMAAWANFVDRDNTAKVLSMRRGG
jgi:integrase